MKELAGTGMVEAYNNQALWNNRQTKRPTEVNEVASTQHDGPQHKQS